MLHNQYVASWSLTGADEALDLRGRVHGQTLDYAQKGTGNAGERELAILWDGLLDHERSEIDRAMRIDKALTLEQALLNECFFMDTLAQDMGAEAAYNLHIDIEDIPKYRAGMSYTFGVFVWELSRDVSEYACSDRPCPFGEPSTQRWYEADI